MKNKLSIFLVIIILLAAGLACSDADSGTERTENPSSSPTVSEELTIDKAEMRGNEDGKTSDKSVTEYGRDEKKLHCYIGWKNPKANTKIKFVWIAADAGNAKNLELKQFELTTENEFQDYAVGKLNVGQPMPRGSYKVDVYINNKLTRSVPFSIS